MYDLLMSEHSKRINRICFKVLFVLSFTALVCVLSGYTQPPQNDEGTAAHIFQFSVVLLAPAITVFLATADWKKPLRVARLAAAPGIALLVAFGALYYLENYRNPHYRTEVPQKVRRTSALPG